MFADGPPREHGLTVYVIGVTSCMAYGFLWLERHSSRSDIVLNFVLFSAFLSTCWLWHFSNKF